MTCNKGQDEMKPDNPNHYDTDELKRIHPISEVAVQCGLELKPAGAGLYRALCPFHTDRTPSLLVDDRDNHAHCFGCGFHGDALDLLMRHHHLSFPDACARLTGIQPTPSSPREKAKDRGPRWDRLTVTEQQVMDTALALYSERLHDSRRALEYLRSRGITDRVISECRLGYADGYSLERYLSRLGQLDTALQLGLLSERDRGDQRAHRTQHRERLAGRVVIPEVRHGACMWMIGRTLSESSHIPKYLGLRGERPVLGLDRAAGREAAYVVEGPFDYLTAVKWDLSAFALCGVRMPEDRLGFLARARVVYGVFDGDRAGREAAQRFRSLLGERFVSVDLPNGVDLADLGRTQGGRERFRELVGRAGGSSQGGEIHG